MGRVNTNFNSQMKVRTDLTSNKPLKDSNNEYRLAGNATNIGNKNLSRSVNGSITSPPDTDIN